MSIVIYTEDEPNVSKALLPHLEEHFAEQGHTVLHFTNGADAVDALHRHKGEIVLLITDLSLEDMIGGLLIARRAVKNGVEKIFILSSSAESEETRRFIERVALGKPVQFALRNKPQTPTTILRIVSELLAVTVDN